MSLPDGISLRTATADDADALTELRLDCWGDADTAWLGTGVGYAPSRRVIDFYRRQEFALDGTEDKPVEGLHLRMVRGGT